jgi:glycosyltransferase involved in cell wall biosynthesis
MHIYRDFGGEGGVPYESLSLAKAQLALGHKIGACFLQKKDFKESDHKGIHMMPISRFSRFGQKGSLESWISEFKPDLIHLYSLWIPDHFLWLPAILRSKAPYVLSPHGTLHPAMVHYRFAGKRNTPFHSVCKALFRKYCDSWILRRCAYLHALSDYEANLAEDAGCKHIVVAPNGIDKSWIKPRKRKSAEEPLQLTFLGRLDSYQKGLDILIGMLEHLRRKLLRQRLILNVVGPDLNGCAAKLAEACSAQSSVELRMPGPLFGQPKDVLLGGTDIFFHLSRFEGMARAAREALARGIPIIASPESNLGAWIARSNAGWQCAIDVAELISILDKVVSEELEIKSQNAQIFSVKYSWEFVAEDMLAQINNRKNDASKV